MKVHVPSLVENEILKEDGSIIKRFGLAWGDVLLTNTIKYFFPVLRKEGQSWDITLKLLGCYGLLCIVKLWLGGGSVVLSLLESLVWRRDSDTCAYTI
jgi:hypothetical protein